MHRQTPHCNKILHVQGLMVNLWSSILGLPDDLIQKGKDIKSTSEIEESGDKFKVTVTTGSKVLVNTFTIGQEAELETLTGEKVKVSQELSSGMQNKKNKTFSVRNLNLVQCIRSTWAVCIYSASNLISSCISKAVVQREGNKLKVNLKGIESVTELVDGNTIVNVSNNAHNFINSLSNLDWFWYFVFLPTDIDARWHCI